jgi:hypothetical protein
MDFFLYYRKIPKCQGTYGFSGERQSSFSGPGEKRPRNLAYRKEKGLGYHEEQRAKSKEKMKKEKIKL